MYFRFAKTTFFILLVFLPAFLADEQLPLHRRTARSVGGFFKRIFGRSKQGFQGTANVNTLYNAQQSSYFPNYSPNGYTSFLTQPSEQLNTAASFADYQNQMPYVSSGYAPSSLQSNYGQGLLSGLNGNQESGFNSQASDLSSYASGYSNGNLAASPNTQYANYALPSNQMASVAGNGQNVDFHKVLDNFVRSAGLSPNGDHETAASTPVEKGETPVFSFKKLYSFPFYLNTEPNSNEGTYFSIPYMRKHIKRVSSDQQVQPQTPSAASALMNYFGGKKLSDITKLYNHNQKYLQSVPATLNASYLNPTYGNQLKRLAYYHVQQQYAKQNAAAANQLPPEIHLINNVHMPSSNQQTPQQNQPTPNVMNQATNNYPTFANPNNLVQSQPSSNKPQTPVNNVAQPSTSVASQSTPQFHSVNNNNPMNHLSVVNQKQQQALIHQAIANPQAFISQYINSAYSPQQPQTTNSNPTSNLNNNSNKLSEATNNSEGDLADEYSGSSYYYGQPQVSVSSSTSTKVSSHKQSTPSSNSQTAHNTLNQSPSSSSAAVSNQQSNSNVSA